MEIGQVIECKHCEGTAICRFSQQKQKCPICSTTEGGLASCKVCEGKGYTAIQPKQQPAKPKVETTMDREDVLPPGAF